MGEAKRAFPVRRVAFTASRLAKACIMMAPVSVFCTLTGYECTDISLFGFPNGVLAAVNWKACGEGCSRARLCDGDDEAPIVPLERVEVRVERLLLAERDEERVE